MERTNVNIIREKTSSGDHITVVQFPAGTKISFANKDNNSSYCFITNKTDNVIVCSSPA